MSTFRKNIVFLMVFFLSCLVLSGCGTRVNNTSATFEAGIVQKSARLNAGEENILILSNGEWEPYTGEALFNNGCDSWIVKEAFALEGIRVEYKFMPWVRGNYEASLGIWDGAIEWEDTPKFREDFYYSEKPISEQNWVFYFRDGETFTYQTWDDLSAKKIGLTIGYGYNGVFDDLPDSTPFTIEEASSDEANFRKLMNGRIDLFLIEEKVGYSILKKSFTEDQINLITKTPVFFDRFFPYVLLSKVNPENEKRIQQYNQGFEKLVNSGRYREIMETCMP